MPMPYPSLLPDQHSTYSELSANLAYMAALSGKHEANLSKEKRSMVFERRKRDKMAVKTKEKLHKRTLEAPDVVSSALIPTIDWSRKEHKKEGNRTQPIGEPSGEETLCIHMSIPRPASGSQPEKAKPQPQKIPPPGAFRRGSGSSSGGSGSGKKLGLACLFCRERKIACGRPSESNPDQTCNQCARRLFKCEYPTESRRGQHKRPKNKPDVT
ncbi:hypothetical protein P691DRAFT_334967 [Macrolepiota fuliginosa MF-IS2]|uniref:Zn(2)-C6 fungal-type domain-containing protein n=1 Tax=Macrolepiota fuliginosa MF-IS2 TaxID=1400762 RepID=A0A9P5X6F8_9AGAR|nr:hypothetical protein P691DRAFT_334967 [Macrolepiota fuliginosa MF-IS2]